ncbi:hypothetical protein Ga0123461_1514 [Mariprofundus aestuarium]|uniref:PilZ domain-containing protein n=1 Tax=Mariprofundus aestuarium TaxID=1921086 RepID=A0A2K8KY86_MARES|nr:hypothetical protein [Mariprofundus aestuarium]ATX79928.1 hypothetical protein Ga0123461_1514 [Mariprofundus aestuarium]
MPDENFSELRGFDRQPIDFEVEVSGFSQACEPFCDRGVLRDISGGGVGFLTNNPDHYKCDQQLNLQIKLPSLDKMDAFMLCEVVVEWVRSIEPSEFEAEAALIGVSLISEMKFESRQRPSENPEIELGN